MGIPYSREINAAFEQVTPLVAAGFKVLRTTKNISILLAVIQVLTVFFLGLILFALMLLLYTVNPDLDKERKQLVTPFLRWLAALSGWDIVKSVVSAVVSTSATLGFSWWLFLWEKGEGVEREGNDDADKALEELDGKEKDAMKAKADKGKKGKEDGKENGKGGKK